MSVMGFRKTALGIALTLAVPSLGSAADGSTGNNWFSVDVLGGVIDVPRVRAHLDAPDSTLGKTPDNVNVRGVALGFSTPADPFGLFSFLGEGTRLEVRGSHLSGDNDKTFNSPTGDLGAMPIDGSDISDGDSAARSIQSVDIRRTRLDALLTGSRGFVIGVTVEDSSKKHAFKSDPTTTRDNVDARYIGVVGGLRQEYAIANQMGLRVGGELALLYADFDFSARQNLVGSRHRASDDKTTTAYRGELEIALFYRVRQFDIELAIRGEYLSKVPTVEYPLRDAQPFEARLDTDSSISRLVSLGAKYRF